MSNSSILSEHFNYWLKDIEKIGILGFGREGRSTLRALQNYYSGKQIIIGDKNPNAFAGFEDEIGNNISVITGTDYLDILQKCDMVFVSPGVPLFDVVISPDVKITSQTDMIFKMFGSKIIAVTGTKGKSTTASLIAHLLRKQYLNVPLAGNIGIPPFDVLDKLIDAEYAVFEVSSHQLQYVSCAPRIAVILNLFPEHLDYYPDVQTYYNAKLNLYRFQTQQDVIILNHDAPLVYEFGMKTKATRFHYGFGDHGQRGAFLNDEKLYFRDTETIYVTDIQRISLKGKHNISNSLAAVCACHAAGLSMDKMNDGLQTFEGLPHRMERIVSVSGKEFYNDSIATIPEATLAALEALYPVSTLILGGMDRGLNYDEFIGKLSEHPLKHICFYGDAGKRMYELFCSEESKIQASYFSTFAECVNNAISITEPREKCLLSPAASSYDQFRNFEERGEFFRNLVINT